MSAYAPTDSAETKYARKGSAVYAALCATKSHPSADTLYQSLKETYPNISRTTVYTNLSKLRDDGNIRCVGVVHGRERFDAVTEIHPHFVCDVCGCVIDLVGLPDTLPLDKAVEAHNSVFVFSHELTFHGLCAECAKNYSGQK